MTTLKLEIKPMGICRMFDEIARAAGIDPDRVQSYNCTKVLVARNLFEKVWEHYGPERSEAFGMDWVVFGPKTSDDLQDSEVQFEDGFIEMKEER